MEIPGYGGMLGTLDFDGCHPCPHSDNLLRICNEAGKTFKTKESMNNSVIYVYMKEIHTDKYRYAHVLVICICIFVLY